ncbi:MAG: isocitrate/isopropylmalate dehydrogenase family protein [Clostridia bacterium]|nr:isocitrate/isopropylmalate dehydrogenase family protein [Clostridia bacterium]
MTDIVLLPGDGIGPEIVSAVRKILDAAGADLIYHVYDVGQTAYEKCGELIPAETFDAIKKYKIALKGPVTTPVGKGFRSVNVSLRLAFDLYANLRPAYSFENVSPFRNVDLITVRENTEDLYIGEERRIEGGFEAVKRITENATDRIINYAFSYAAAHGRKKVTCVHKANILKKTDGLFLSIFREIAAKYPEIAADDKIVDNMCMQLVTRPEDYDVIVAPNLYGDIISDLIAGLVGGLGLVAGANLGKDVAVFEAVHGSAPDIAGKGIANPVALLEAAVMMLEHIGKEETARKIKAATVKTLARGVSLTKDLGGGATTDEFTEEVIKNL